MNKKTLCIATHNPHKALEMAPVLAPFWEVKCSADYPEMAGLEVIEETGDTFLANATLKAVATSQVITDYVLADDSGLECDALDGAPGVFSARYGGIPSSAEKNNAKLLQELTRVGAMTPEQRRARFRDLVHVRHLGIIGGAFYLPKWREHGSHLVRLVLIARGDAKSLLIHSSANSVEA